VEGDDAVGVHGDYELVAVAVSLGHESMAVFGG
jgi:hypothetical protein